MASTLCGSVLRIPHKSIRSNLSLNSSTILWREEGQSGPALRALKSRGYAESDLIDGVVITGASVMHERIKAGAATLSF